MSKTVKEQIRSWSVVSLHINSFEFLNESELETEIWPIHFWIEDSKHPCQDHFSLTTIRKGLVVLEKELDRKLNDVQRKWPWQKRENLLRARVKKSYYWSPYVSGKCLNRENKAPTTHLRKLGLRSFQGNRRTVPRFKSVIFRFGPELIYSIDEPMDSYLQFLNVKLSVKYCWC